MIARRLGLTPFSKTLATFSDGRKELLDLVAVRIELMGRSGIYTAVVRPRLRTIRIGQIVLNDLDLIIDHKRGRLKPKNKRRVIYEI
jgi:hypothetical protein